MTVCKYNKYNEYNLNSVRLCIDFMNLNNSIYIDIENLIYVVFQKYKYKLHNEVEKDKIKTLSRMTIGLKPLRFRDIET